MKQGVTGTSSPERNLKLTPANQLTLLRIILVPLFVLLLVSGRQGSAVIVFLAAGLTDVLDGLVARRLGQKTALGTLLDPIADKLLLVSSFIVLSLQSLGLAVHIPQWLLIIVIGRDLLIALSVLMVNLLNGKRVFPPSVLGKAATAAQSITVVAVLVSNWLRQAIGGLEALFYVTAALTVGSAVHYLLRGAGLLNSTQQQNPREKPQSTTERRGPRE